MKAHPIVKPIVRVKKIPLENGRKFLGLCYTDEHYIEIERDQPDSEFLDTCIHELLHHFFPSLSEKRVEKTANIIAQILWEKGYRKRRRKRERKSPK